METTHEMSAAAGALREATGHVKEARADVTATSQRLGREIESIGAKWGGEGARAFKQLHTRWQEKQTTIVRVLDDFAEQLTETDRDNLATDAAQAEISARLLSRLG